MPSQQVVLICFILLSFVYHNNNAHSFFFQSNRLFGERPLQFWTIHRLNVQEQNVSPTITTTTDYDKDKDAVRVRCRVAYDGSGFQGWQTQKLKGRTAQGEVESTLSRRLNRNVKIVGASRTDAGVHGRGQAIHFDLYKHKDNIPKDDDFTSFEWSINKMLPPDVKIWNLCLAPKPASPLELPWHAIISSTKKLYSYRISTRKALDPLQRYTRAHVHQPMNITKLKHILHYYKGTHDFRAFSGAIEANQRKKNKRTTNTSRTIYDIQFVEEEVDHGSEHRTGLYRIDIVLNGALYKMIRNMIGTALDLCVIHEPSVNSNNRKRPRITEELFLDLLYQRRIEGCTNDTSSVEDKIVVSTRDDNPCKPAPPEGLTLERVYYDDDF